MGNKDKYYLINGKIMKGGEMPKGEDYVSIKPTFFNKTWFESDKKEWMSSLKPCEISESELFLILSNVSKLDYDNPIDVTDIVSDNDGVIKFKEPNQFNVIIVDEPNPTKAKEDSEAVEFAEWTYKNHWVLNQKSMYWYIELPSGVIDLSTGKTSIELYEIFKSK